MRFFEAEGETPAEILKQFTLQHDIPAEYVKVEVLDAGSKGFLGIGKKTARVKLVFDDYEFLKRKAKLYLSEILDKAGFESYSIEIEDKKPYAVLNIMTSESNMLIGKAATTLDSLQYLVDRVVRPMDTDVSIMVDVDDYRKRVVEPLKEKALKLAQNVAKTGRPAKMSPMCTFVRREIHVVAKSVPGVTTFSIGDGQVKTVSIVSEKKGSQPRGESADRPPRRDNRNRRRNDNRKEK